MGCQVKLMMEDGFSTRDIQIYLCRWGRWWVRTVESWQVLELLKEFQERCFDGYLKVFIEALLQARCTTGEDEQPVVLSNPA